MAKILAIETSGSNCGVGIWATENEPMIIEENGSKIHSEKLPLFVQEVLANSNLSLNDLDAIAVSSGPGSYTGLRIGMSFAKGLAFGGKIQLLPINTIDSIANGLNKKIDFTILVYSHAGFVYDKNYLKSGNGEIIQTEIKDVYPNPLICVNFPENKKTLKNADYKLSSVKFIGEFSSKFYDDLDKPKLNEISPRYYSEFKIRK